MSSKAFLPAAYEQCSNSLSEMQDIMGRAFDDSLETGELTTESCYVMFPSIKCTQTFVNGPLMSVLSKDGGLTFVHVTQRTVIPISLHPLFSH